MFQIVDVQNNPVSGVACSFKFKGYSVSLSHIFSGKDVAIWKDGWPDVLSFNSVEEALDYILAHPSN